MRVVLLLSLLMGTGLTGQALIGTDAVIGMAASMIKVSMFSSIPVAGSSRAFLGADAWRGNAPRGARGALVC